MNLLVITGLYPTEATPYGGIFITKRLEQYINMGMNVQTVTITVVDSYLVAKLKGVFKRPKVNHVNFLPNINVNWSELPIKRTLINVLVPETLNTKIANKVRVIYLKQKSYDLISAHWAYPDGLYVYNIAKRNKLPYVMTLHGSDIHTNPFNNREIMEKTKTAVQGANACIYVSDKLKQVGQDMSLVSGCDFTIYNGYDPKLFYFVNKEHAKHEIGIDCKKAIGYVGNLVDVKNVMKLPDIFARIRKALPDVCFIIVGEGSLREDLERECLKRNLNCVFTGRLSQEDVAKHMQAIDVLMLPSMREGFGAVLIEAQACGTYVTGSDVGGIPEAIGASGKTFPLTDSFNEDISGHIIDVLINGFDSQAIIDNVANMSWGEISRKEYEVFKQAIRPSNEETNS